MRPDHERELRDLLRAFTHRKRSSYRPEERFAVLKRWGTVGPVTFAQFSDAFSFAKGYINGPHEERACAFVVDTDPEHARAHLVADGDSASIVHLTEEIRALYNGVVDGERYAENLVEERQVDRQRAAHRESEEQKGKYLLFAMIIGGILLFIFLFK